VIEVRGAPFAEGAPVIEVRGAPFAEGAPVIEVRGAPFAEGAPPIDEEGAPLILRWRLTEQRDTPIEFPCTEHREGARESESVGTPGRRGMTPAPPSPPQQPQYPSGMTTREEQEAIWAEAYARLTPDRRRVADDTSKRAQDKVDQQLQWADELLALADLLAACEPGSAPWPVVRLFWVRLHGVVTELIENHRSTVELAKTMPKRELARSLIRSQ